LKNGAVPAVIALLALGCSGNRPPGELPSDYDFDAPPPPEPLSLAEIEAAVPAAIDSLFQVNPLEVFPIYDGARGLDDDFVAGADPETCPRYDDVANAGGVNPDGVTHWTANNCTAASGAVFSGDVVSHNDAPGVFVDGDGNAHSIHARIEGSGRIFLPGGGRFESQGRLAHDEFTVSGTSEIRNSLRFSGKLLAGTSWLAENISADYDLDSSDDGAGDRSLDFNGGVGGLSGAFESIFSFGFDINTSCAAEPNGSIFFRDQAGLWYRIDFSRDSCDGAGNVTLIGVTETPLGSVSPNVSRLISWGGRPW
jgi:hypothetical protein